MTLTAIINTITFSEEQMDDVVCARIQLQPNSLPHVRKWAAHMNLHKEYALQTLRHEGVTIESVFLESVEGEGDYLIYYMRAASLKEAAEVARSSLAAIDEYHKAFKQATWAKLSRLEMLLDLEIEKN
jgi:hypothetical protein